jgi:hypothetical protein
VPTTVRVTAPGGRDGASVAARQRAAGVCRRTPAAVRVRRRRLRWPPARLGPAVLGDHAANRAQTRRPAGARGESTPVGGRADPVRREALCCIPGSAGRDLEGGSWASRLRRCLAPVRADPEGGLRRSMLRPARTVARHPSRIDLQTGLGVGRWATSPPNSDRETSRVKERRRGLLLRSTRFQRLCRHELIAGAEARPSTRLAAYGTTLIHSPLPLRI